jgi:VIT1/CCC1 family predicted Fe2+/Mn2+ transporter
MTKHKENHIKSSKLLQDITIGMADGLTVPFALAAGLSGVVDSTGIVLTAGIAEIAAGSIAMGLGGYLSAKTAIEHYNSEEEKEFLEITEVPHIEKQEVSEMLEEFGVSKEQIPTVASAICSNPKKWVDFMMRFELGLERPDPKRIIYTPITIGTSYIFGGLIPLTPYMLTSNSKDALYESAIITMITLFIFGGLKGYFSGTRILRSSFETTLIGGAAAAAAYTLARLIS